MRLFLLPELYNGENIFELTGNDYHYLVRVLRYKKGHEFSGRDNKGNFFDLTLQEIFEDRCLLKAVKTVVDQIKLPEIIIYQCVCKGKKMDQIIRQTTEVGVFRIIPVVSDFSVARIDTDKHSKMDRWRKIIREAIQQSGSRITTQIGNPISIDEIEILSKNEEIGLFFHQEVLDNSKLHGYLGTDTERISLVIGPEGGLSDREIDILYNKHYKSVNLKTNVLRAETATLYAVSAVQTILLESENWMLRV